MKENVLDVLMYLFENYFYDEPDEEPDRDSMEENLHLAGFSNGEIDKAFAWLDGLAEQRYQPEFAIRTDQPIRVFVDTETERRLMDNLRAEFAGRSLILITHRPSLLPLVDRVIVMAQGRIAMDGTPGSVLSRRV